VVHQRKDTDVLPVWAVENAERETAEEVPSNSRTHADTDFRVLVDLLEGLLEVEDEVLAKAGCAICVETYGFQELSLGQRVKKGAHSGHSSTSRIQDRVKGYASGLAARDLVVSSLRLSLPLQLQLGVLIEARDQALCQARALGSGELQDSGFKLIPSHSSTSGKR
jgi:hypothetical protein